MRSRLLARPKEGGSGVEGPFSGPPGGVMRVLLHICCANCAIYPVEWLRKEGHEVMGLFFNPNIQPYQELLRRKEAVERLSVEMQLRVIHMVDYPLEEFLRRVVFREEQRCLICYQWRLGTTARVARRGRHEAFTTTLLFSKRQDHELVAQVGAQEARRAGVAFLDEDFRKGWQQGNSRSREMGLYRQSYCGCIYSERDRFAPRRQRRNVLQK